jgi:tetratricopeptide (TPR) repeat protein
MTVKIGARVTLTLALAAIALGGCATAYGRGETALRQGRYEDARRHFEEALERDQTRTDARLGLGVALYKAGMLARAADTLAGVVRAEPRSADARLYLALAALRRGDNEATSRELAALRDLDPHPRFTAQIERALRLIAGDLPEPMREFVAAALEDELEWMWTVQEARRISRAFAGSAWILEWDHRSLALPRGPYFSP